MTEMRPGQIATTRPSRASRIVLTAVGSLGDLHPYVAIALGLKARGHEAIVATSACYRQKIEALGLGFCAVRPDSDFVTDPAVMRRIMDLRRGTFRVLRELILTVLRDSYEDTLAAADGADLLVSHTIFYATRLVSETTGIPWVSTIITPTGLFSAFDPPLLPGFPGLSKSLRPLGPAFWGPVGRFLKGATSSWAGPCDRLRKEIGLPPTAGNPLVDGHSPALVLALFSKVLAGKQSDWPPQTVITGFPYFDQDGEAGLPPDLVRFLGAGPPPLVFTLGMSSATVAGSFFEYSVAAAKRLGRRAVLVLGKNALNRPTSLPEGVVAIDYAPFSELFPRAAAIVHAGGIGTTGLAMRAGRPTLVVPFAHDQPDNAERAARLGVARIVYPRRYTPTRVAEELRRILDDPSYAQRASEVGKPVRQEDGVRVACDALEALIRERPDALTQP
jgi:UDP:flavonoid glycosyltransferase YjiC (YdhE family)